MGRLTQKPSGKESEIIQNISCLARSQGGLQGQDKERTKVFIKSKSKFHIRGAR